jgi:hypothetical protein
MGPNPKWLRRVSSAQGKSLWMMKAPSALLTGMDLDALEKLIVWLAAATPAAKDFKTNRLDSVCATTAFPNLLVL